MTQQAHCGHVTSYKLFILICRFALLILLHMELSVQNDPDLSRYEEVDTVVVLPLF